MEFLKTALDFFLHLDDHIGQLIQTYPTGINFILFMIIFCETGLVVTPFLPGDSLLFVVGTFAARGDLNLWLMLVLLSVAAVLGDAVNYSIGYFFGPKLTHGGNRFIKKEYLDRTHRFYEKYGKMTIILARFVPIVRTFAPFLAGVGSMRYAEFALYNVIGGLVWVFSLTLLGFFFGNLPFVKEHFETVIFAIIGISVLPLVIEYFKHRRDKVLTEPLNPGADKTEK